MAKKLLMLMMCLLTGTFMYAQVSVSGKVTDAKGEALPGADVVVKGTNKGTATDIDGQYKLSVPADATLVVSYYGYTAQEIKVGNRSVVNVVLEEDKLMLDETVVVAFGTQKKRDLTGSITSIEGQKISTQAQSTVSRALEGSAPGLRIAAAEGQPGWDTGIIIRGFGTAKQNNASALVIVDGAPVETNSTDVSALSSINPADIASMTILKDAASTALYGSRGANGVVLITTKRGQSGKAKISFEGRWGINAVRPNGLVEKLGNKNPGDYYETQWLMIKNDVEGKVANPAEFASQHLFDYNGSIEKFGANNLGNWMLYKVPGATYTYTGGYDGDNHIVAGGSSTMSGAYLVNPDGKLNPNAELLYKSGDYYRELASPSFRQEYKVSASGGNDKSDYYVSLGYLSDPSYIRNSSFDRLNVRSNVNAQLTDWLKVGANVAYGRRDTERQAIRWGRDPGNASQNIFRWITGTSPLRQLYARDASGNYKLDAAGNKITHLGNSYANHANGTMTDSPLGLTESMSYDLLKLMDQSQYNVISNDLNLKGYVEATFLKDFKFTANVSLDDYFQNMTRFYNVESAGTFIGTSNGSAIKKVKSEYRYINTVQMLSYVKDINEHHIDAIAGHEFYQYDYDYMQWGSQHALINDATYFANYLGLATYSTFGATSGGGITKQTMEGYMARVNYVYANKYYASASYRRDGSSKFKKPELRWGNFWSLGAGWRISSEKFMEGTQNWLDNLKLRASYGVTGNQNGIGYYSGYQTWTYSGAGTWTSGTSSQPSSFNLSQGALVNDSITWENVYSFDLGLDFGFLNNKVNGAIDFYNRNTPNAVWAAPISVLQAGQVTLDQNSACIRNRGVEIELTWNAISTKNVSLTIGANGTHYRTTLISVPEGTGSAQLDGCWATGDDGYTIAGQTGRASDVCYLRGEGKDYYNMFIYKYGGVAGNPGLDYYTATGTTNDGDAHKQNQTIATGYTKNSADLRGNALYYHHVTAAEAKATGLKEGEDILVTDKGLADRYEVGTATPWWIGGLSADFRYKNFDVSVQFAYQLGGYFHSEEYASGEKGEYNVVAAMTSQGNASQDVYQNTWTEDNPSAKFPMIRYSDPNNSATVLGSGRPYTDACLFSASYLSLKNITLGYNVPQNIVKKAGISAFRVFASADNTFLWYPVSGVDPRASLTGGFGTVGAAAYPSMATYNLGVNLTF
ncbi:MAG: SusC/RagA family TonB-linked outer membrane protein [Bacteroidales bacterium]|nr:SusC/RagA family TonB-linked outer membrane protein [Bacteroidales bacterium]